MSDLVKKHPHTLIYLGGDIVHSKLELSPESVDLTQYLFKGLTDIAPTILIMGNHDCNLNNKSRPDSLTPIVTAMNLPNFYYLRESGVYRFNNIDFTVMGLQDSPDTYLDPDTTNTQYKVALHHGAVDDALDVGLEPRQQGPDVVRIGHGNPRQGS